MFLVVTLVFLVTGGKGYYLAGAIVPLVAAGCTWVARSRSTRRLVEVGAVLGALGRRRLAALVPVLPVSTYADSFFRTHRRRPARDDRLAGVRRHRCGPSSPTCPDGAVVFTGNYGEAGAFEWYDVGAPVYSGHNGWRNWGPPPDGTGPVVVVFYRDPAVDFTGCERAATLHNDVGIDNEEEGHGVWVCDGPIGSWSQRWDELSHYDA